MGVLEGYFARHVGTATGAGCWEWEGARNSLGYGRFNIDGRSEYAHRIAYALAHDLSSLDELGVKVIDHLCHNPPCVNPDHLALVEHATNIRRGYQVKKQTHCKRGHDLALSAHITRDGRRDCYLCRPLRKAEKAESDDGYGIELPPRRDG